MKLIRRDDYLSVLAAMKDAPDIKILCGMRRAGKSKLMDEHVRTIRKTKPGANVIPIDMTLLKNEKLHDYHALHEFVRAHSKRTEVNYLLIDEVQMCPKFELAINSLHAEKNRRYDIYLTGSNAFLLSSDLTTLFTGRHHEIRTYPFSFREFRRYFSARYAVLGRRNMDYGHVYENIVCIELLRRGYEVYVGKLYQKEIDFIAMRGSEKIYIQVSDDISEPKTLSRELEPLGKIRDSYPKLLIARTRHDETDRDGVRIIDIARWLEG